MRYINSESLSKEDAKMIRGELIYDIETGVYDKFPKLRKSLEAASEQLAKYIFLINGDYPNRHTFKLLEDNGYIEKQEDLLKQNYIVGSPDWYGYPDIF